MGKKNRADGGRRLRVKSKTRSGKLKNGDGFYQHLLTTSFLIIQ
jgi:hypothetical protein